MSLITGKEAKKLFALADGFTNFNHGSFGACPWEVKKRQDELFDVAEQRPDKWFRETFYELQKEARSLVAKMINAKNVDDLVLVENASTAINSLLRCKLSKGDKIMRLSTAYNMCIETFSWLGCEQVVVEVNFPVKSKDQLVDAVSKAMQENPDIKLCCFSHISSLPTLIEPVEEFSQICKEINSDVMILVDGAHAPGVLEVDIDSLGCDFYTGNLHKWCYAPKGCAFMWVSKKASRQWEELAPTVISSTGERSYVGRFSYTGTRDYTAFCTIPAALQFCDKLGGSNKITKHNHDLIIAGARLCAEKWGTCLLAPEEFYGVMVDVVLPELDWDKVMKIHNRLKDEDDIYMIGKPWEVNGEPRIITRLSANIYLELDDFETLASKFLKYQGEIDDNTNN